MSKKPKAIPKGQCKEVTSLFNKHLAIDLALIIVSVIVAFLFDNIYVTFSTIVVDGALLVIFAYLLNRNK
jgi:hypothetical protein